MKAQPKQVLVVYNPGSGTVGDLDRRLGELVRRFAEEKGYVVNVRPMEPGMTSSELLAPVMGEFELVVAVGGDGTVGTVLGAVAEAGLKAPVGIVPFGTGNLLAKTLKICTDESKNILHEAMDTILHGETIPLDLGRMNNNWFTIDAGTGPIADAITLPVKEHKTHFRLWAYGWPLLRSISRRPLRYKIEIDDQEPFTVEASGIFVTNSKEMGIGTHGVREVSDGTFDLIVMNPRTIQDYWNITKRFGKWFLFGQQTAEAPYMVRRVKKVKIDVVPKLVPRSSLQKFARITRNSFEGKAPAGTHGVAKAAMAMVDGDPCGSTPMFVEVVPHAVNVRVPLVAVQKQTQTQFANASR